MTPLEAIAEALKAHVYENDQDFERWCARFLRSLKASGYELVEIEDPEAEKAAFVRDVATDPLAFLKARQDALREEFHALGDDARRRGVEHPGVKDREGEA